MFLFRVSLLSFVVLFISVVGIFAQADDVIEYIVIAETANLRSGAGTNFATVGSVDRGDIILIYDEPQSVSGWYRIFSVNGEETTAYIADFLVERAPMRWYSPEQEPIATIEGRGRSVSDIVEIPRGIYRVDAVVGDRSFILSSLTIDGTCRDQMLFNSFNFNVNNLVMSELLVSTGCSFIFEAENVDGNWTVEIRDLLAVEALSQAINIEDGTQIQGEGMVLTMLTNIDEGIWNIQASVRDQAFILSAHSADDCGEETIINELNFDANLIEVEAIYRVPRGGCIVWWATDNVDGAWELTFSRIR